jgi:hypothetical protein
MIQGCDDSCKCRYCYGAFAAEPVLNENIFLQAEVMAALPEAVIFK